MEESQSFVDKLKSRRNPTPKIGLLYSGSSSDEKESGYSLSFVNNLEKMGSGCTKVELDYHTIIREFEEEVKDISSSEGYDREAELLKYVKNLVKKKELDALVFPGDWYNAIAPNINPSPDRMDVEKALFITARDLGLPLLGVCGGEQHVAFFCDAELSSNVEMLTGDNHRMSCKDSVHDIKVVRNSALYGNIEGNGSREWKKRNTHLSWEKYYKQFNTEGKEVKVNSMHSQGVVNNDETIQALKGNNLEVVATDRTGKLVEAIEQIYGRPVTLVQFHPEYETTEYETTDFDKKIMASFIQAASVFAARKVVVDEFMKHIKPKLKESFLSNILANDPSLMSNHERTL